ncbi:V0D/AC39 family V-type ATPase subunit [Caproiciproducens sp. CPB-2]|uniref:V0D/AC39 family V-type ATPase subunit n=1 Tax=Caproiciproducens sp. CPB-2 TaxID=3030017 RepID=UPI0023DBF43C|nr:V-type ATPase subunit [Caproiciproducens sp. CPB-2]MDF1495952.1 V-type ATPase subunit [Caproiciproducens sp. CPB-2]
MLSTFSSNAILSKARAMYGRRLTKQNYRELLACQNVGEIANYLKTRTAYGKALAGIDQNSVHRGQLEAKLKQKLFDDYASLCRYEISVGDHFSRYPIMRSEIEQILHSILLLEAGTPEDYLFSLPMYLTRHTHINLTALSQMKSYDDLLSALSHTPYQKLLEGFKPIKGIPINYTGIENALYTYLYQNLFEVIDRYTHGETARQLRDIFNSYIDLINYARIIRLKASYNAGPDFIRSSLLPFGNINKRILNEMIEAENADAVTELMERTSIGKHFLKIEHSYAGEISNRVKYMTCRHDIHFSTHPSVVMISYTFIMETEVRDIITIVEGIRYKLPPEEIVKLLVVYHFNERSD